MRIEKNYDENFNTKKIENVVLHLSDRVDLIITTNHENKTAEIKMHDNISNIIDLYENVDMEGIRQIIGVLREIWVNVNDYKLK